MAIAKAPVQEEGKAYDDEGYLIADDEPMAETIPHRRVTTYTIDGLEVHFADRPDVYVSGDDFIHYQEGDRTKYVSPDCYVIFGVDKRVRMNFKVWQEGGKTPSVVFEFTSKETRREDTGRKFRLYEQVLKVAEYFLSDPLGEYLDPPLRGYRLREGRYVPIELVDGRMYSEELGLYLVVEGELLRLYDPVSGEYLRTYQEAEIERLAERQRAEHERQRAENEQQRAKTAIQIADEARQFAETQKQRADDAEVELARLRAELDAPRRQQESDTGDAE